MHSQLYAGLFCTLLLFLLLPVGRLGPAARAALLAALGLAVLVPIEGVNLTMRIRAISGDLSVFSVYWLACASAGRFTAISRLAPPRQTRTAALTIALAALFLYPATLGLSQWDPYRLGYDFYLPMFCAALVGVMVWTGQRFTAMAVSLCLAAYAVRLLESENLWDYLLDPWLAGYAFYRLVKNRTRGTA